MKVSELTAEFLADYIRTDKTIQSEIAMITAMRSAAVKYVCNYTGLREYELEEHEDITLAVMVLVQDMYDTRSMYVQTNNVNRTVEGILDMHRVNLI